MPWVCPGRLISCVCYTMLYDAVALWLWVLVWLCAPADPDGLVSVVCVWFGAPFVVILALFTVTEMLLIPAVPPPESVPTTPPPLAALLAKVLAFFVWNVNVTLSIVYPLGMYIGNSAGASASAMSQND